jgi:3-oxoacyl-[acyl-carrier protein] reductase
MEIREIAPRSTRQFRFPWSPAVDLSGMTILAFGAGGNLAAHFLRAAAACGARPVLFDLQPPDGAAGEEIERLAADLGDLAGGETPPLLLGDVTRGADVQEACRWADAQCGGIDVVIDFAGIHHRPFDPAGDDAEEEEIFRRVTEINLTGAFLVTRHAAGVMVPRRSGHIIHLCSNGSRLSLYGSYAYNASKHGVEGLVKTAAAQLAPFGLRVNGFAPGTVETDLNRSLLRDERGELRPRARSILAHTPSKRFISKEGVSQSLLALCLPQRHLTGNVIFADDGYNIEGHSWPEGNAALYAGAEELERLFERLDRDYPPAE